MSLTIELILTALLTLTVGLLVMVWLIAVQIHDVLSDIENLIEAECETLADERMKKDAKINLKTRTMHSPR